MRPNYLAAGAVVSAAAAAAFFAFLAFLAFFFIAFFSTFAGAAAAGAAVLASSAKTKLEVALTNNTVINIANNFFIVKLLKKFGWIKNGLSNLAYWTERLSQKLQ